MVELKDEFYPCELSTYKGGRYEIDLFIEYLCKYAANTRSTKNRAMKQRSLPQEQAVADRVAAGYMRKLTFLTTHRPSMCARSQEGGGYSTRLTDRALQNYGAYVDTDERHD